jgi:hypothetical protein
MLLAGVATITLSLALSIAPAMAAKGGNAGVAKIHDAVTDLEADEQGNEPWVCTFWVGFYASNPTETGTWQILSWPPTGDGTVVVSGTYDTTDDGVDATADQGLADGHYRLTWLTDGDNNEKHKTFWVECGDPEPAATEEPLPTDEASASAVPTPTESATPSEEVVPTDEPSPSVEPTPSVEVSPTAEPTGDVQGEGQTPSPTPDQEDPDATDEASPTPEEDVLAGNPSPVASPEAPEGGTAPADGGATELPDTSLPVQPSGVLATIGVLLIIAAHMGTRRARSLPTA